MDKKVSPALDFETWMSERHRWLQTAAADLLETRRFPSTSELEELVKLCKQETQQTTGLPYRSIAPGSYDQASARPPFRVEKLTNVQGMAAIKSGAALNFTDAKLTVVYGPNGSGKTGFSRLIKQICGSKTREEIYPNVFEANNPPCSADLEITIGGTDQKLSWNLSDGPCAPMRNVHVFDSKTALVYVFGKTEASYEPSRMRFVSSLIKICDIVSASLATERDGKVSCYPRVPPNFAETPTGTWAGKLTAAVRDRTIEEKCLFTEEQGRERSTLEAALNQKDVPGRLAAIVRERTALSQLQNMLQAIKSQYSEEQLKAIKIARVDAIEKRTAATRDAARLFSESNIEGVGAPSWRLFWAHAKSFATEVAYVNKPFPYTEDDSHCLLCHQPLSKEAQERLHHFESYIKSHLEAEADKAEKHLAIVLGKLPSLPPLESWILQTAALKVPEEAAKLFEHIQACHEFAQAIAEGIPLPQGNWKPCEDACIAQIAFLLSEETSLKAIQQDEKRKEIIARVVELQALEWAAQNKEAIVAEVKRLQIVSGLNKAISLTSTTALTKKNNELAENELSAGYQARFQSELIKLGGGRLNVLPLCKKEGKGRTTFGISLKDVKTQAKAESILSEGETRIVALAAFIADITGNNQATPFIFDDPISSLDQDFEERVIKRLVELSESRQVIIFTHRLSLVAQVEAEFKGIANNAEKLKLPVASTMRIETLRRMNKQTGIVVPSRLRDQKPEKALNLFLNDLIPQAKRLASSCDPDYERYALSLCSDLRILVERSVEIILLNEVVMRFRRSVTTQNRIISLAKIEAKDCAFLEDLMTRYSVFEHSQSDELAAPVPDLSEIEVDVQALASWVKEFAGRTVSVTQ
jgi:energy-coupling factor transporter ATP-binding protein EcfA2